MSLKNIFVRGEKLKDGVRGLRYANYLINENHPNHKKSRIVKIHNHSRQWIENSLHNAIEANQKKIISGGRPTTRFGHSFVFSLPKNQPCPSNEQWKEISKNIIKSLSQSLKLSPREISRNSLIVLHNQSNPHIHLLVSSVISQKTYNQQLSSEVTMKRLKKTFDFSCLKILGFDKTLYKPNTKLTVKLNKQQLLKKEIERAEIQLRKLLIAIDEKDLKQYKRQLNRLKKTSNKIRLSDESISNQIDKKIMRMKNEKRRNNKPT